MLSAANDRQNTQHNHTYSASPSTQSVSTTGQQRSRSAREEDARREREEHATRCRDEKKAKDMQVLDNTARSHLANCKYVEILKID